MSERTKRVEYWLECLSLGGEWVYISDGAKKDVVAARNRQRILHPHKEFRAVKRTIVEEVL